MDFARWQRYRKIFPVVMSMLLVVMLFTGCSGNSDLNSQGNSPEQANQSEEGNSFKAGVYTAEAKGNNGAVKVEVAFSEAEITSVKVIEHSETQGLGDTALEQISKEIVDGQTLAIDAVSGASNSTQAILTAVEDCVKQAGGDVALLMVAKDKPDLSGQVEKLSTDVVVIGAGGSGSAAAVQAAELGAKVILLEKNAQPGGTTAMGGGLFGADSKLMRELGEEPVDTDALFEDWMKEMVWKADANLIRRYLALSGTTVDWLIERGFELHKVGAVQKTHEAYHGYHKYDPWPPTEMFKKLLSGLDEHDGQILYETPAQKLIIDSSGAVTGVIAKKKDGSTLEITAKSVVIASGGFVGDTEWVSETLDGVTVASGGLTSNVGDGIKMAWEIGAAHRGDNVHLAHVTKIPGDLSAFGDTATLANSSLAYLAINPWVNASGVRFANEDIVQDRAYTTNAVISQGNYVYAVFSQSMLDTLEAKGAAALGLQEKVSMGPISELTPMETGWTNLNAMVEELIKQGFAFKGDSFKELAEKAGMDAEKFTKNMEKYDGDAKAGKDSVFGKRKEHMVALGDGPYYAIRVNPTNLSTLGGIRINEDMQVVASDPNNYAPIPNLYAAGADVGGLYSDHYVLLEGGAQGWAYNSGRMAGASAASNAMGQLFILPGLESFY